RSHRRIASQGTRAPVHTGQASVDRYVVTGPYGRAARFFTRTKDDAALSCAALIRRLVIIGGRPSRSDCWARIDACGNNHSPRRVRLRGADGGFSHHWQTVTRAATT